MSKVEETIKDRHEKYGDYANYTAICFSLKSNIRFAKNLSLHPMMKETLDMIFVKIARILNGDPNLIDNWHDIAGYARLVEIELQKEN